ncbi:AraC family transcriptional regulator [Neorhizobium sp. DT-125]|uniref:AraC family transcriptional regulator n=1 Tax=Neorhizobium sp. DT-125 TaxID=3396163 RepID=UPI003F1B1B01
MDPLSDALSLLKPQSHVSSGFDAGGDWSIYFPIKHDVIKCYSIVSGGCWLSIEGRSDPVRLNAGDCFVLPSGRPFRLASDLRLMSEPSSAFFPPAERGGVVTVNGGGGVFLAGSRFTVSGGHAAVLMGMMPPVVHIDKESEQTALRWAIDRMRQELREQQPGGSLVAQHLAHMMLLQALRLHLAEGADKGTGWFAALADKQLCAAISAIHADPARRWTLKELASIAAMSRSSFAQRFKEAAGETPMEYLTRWRILLASDRLENSSDTVSVIGHSLGYEAEGAFIAAFKRIMGCTPRQYGHRKSASRVDGEQAAMRSHTQIDIGRVSSSQGAAMQ